MWQGARERADLAESLAYTVTMGISGAGGRIMAQRQ